MARQHVPLFLTLLYAPLSLGLVIAPRSVAQTQLIETTTVWASFTPPRGGGTPKNRLGGATRSPGCIGDNVSENERFLSLMPEYSEITSQRPSFVVYIPKTVAQKAFFSLRDASEDYSYEKQIPLPKTPGTYRLQLPADAPSIVPNKKYQWFLTLVCGKAVNLNDPRVEGLIQFVKFD